MSRWGSVKKSLAAKSVAADSATDAPKEWELRPGGMLVQMRDPSADAAHAGPLLRLKVSYGRMHHHVSINANSTFGDLKKLLIQDSGLQPEQQRILYKGKERSDRDCLQEAGLKDKSKILLVEDTVGWEKRLIELRKTEASDKACKAVVDVQQLVDKLSGQIADVESSVNQGKRLPDTDLTGLIDLLMCQLLKLDESKVDGEANVKKRILERRVQKYVETLDVLVIKNNALKAQMDVTKARPTTAKAHGNLPMKVQHNVYSPKAHGNMLMKPQNNVQSPGSPTVVTTAWESFGSNFGPTKLAAATAMTTAEPLLIQWD